MRHIDETGYGSGDRQGCLRETRADVLLQLERWLKDEQDHRIFWLNGLAGTGKSTIAQTFAEISFADGKLGPSFFCSRDFEDRSNLRAIFPTTAFQLAYRYLPFPEKLLRDLRANPDIGQASLCSQMERIIVGPLKAVRIVANQCEATARNHPHALLHKLAPASGVGLVPGSPAISPYRTTTLEPASFDADDGIPTTSFPVNTRRGCEASSCRRPSPKFEYLTRAMIRGCSWHIGNSGLLYQPT